MKDPGPQLRQVLEFERSQRELGEVLFKEVCDLNHWRSKFPHWLWAYVSRLILASRTTEQEPSGVISVAAPSDAGIITPLPLGGDWIPQQLVRLSALLGRTLQKGVGLFFAGDHSAPDDFDEFSVGRLHLLSATLISDRYTREILGTHEVNLLYKYRDRLDATPFEMHGLFRSLVDDSSDVRPGWFWVQETEEVSVGDRLLALALQDPSDHVRAQALELLTAAHIEIHRDFWPALLHQDSPAVRGSAFKWLAEVAGVSALSFLEELSKDQDAPLASEARAARLQILSQLDPGGVLSELIGTSEYIPEDTRRLLQAHISVVDEPILLRATGSAWADIRQMSLQELARRDRLSVELAGQFTEDPSTAVRVIAFQSLARRGSLPDLKIVRDRLNVGGPGLQNRLSQASALFGGLGAEPRPDVDSIIVTFFETQTTAYLLSAVDWFSLEGPLAYQALAQDRFDAISSDLRADLRSGFRRVKQESFSRVEKEAGPKAATRLAEQFEELDEFVRSRFTRAAVFGLAKNAQPGDAELVRPYLAHGDKGLRDAAVAVIAKTGNSDDVAALTKIAAEPYGDAQAEAAAGALKLSGSALGVARELLVSSSHESAKVAFRWMLTHDSSEVRKIFEDLLDDKEETNRLRALQYLSKHLQAQGLEELLKDYMNRATYYYNVVTWLDRLLYAPAPLKRKFVSDLGRERD